MKKMQAAQGRWEAQLRNGAWKTVSAQEASEYVKSGDFYFLDVRPSTEHDKASVKGSIWIPMYDVNKHADPATIYKKIQNVTMGGWWSGQALMKYNERFMPDIVAKIPKSSKIIVACQKGLRSLAACEQLYKVGYRNLYWLSGGLDAVDENELEREGPKPFKLAGIGGVSEFLGWTDVQRSEASKLGFGYRAMLFGRVILLLLAVDLFFLGSQQLAELIGDLRH
jgi:rhodanese-related sulfurtransferase